MPNFTTGMIERTALAALIGAGVAEKAAGEIAWACGWLESAGYPGLAMLAEALETTPAGQRSPTLSAEYGLVDTGGVSCAFLAPDLALMAKAHGRIVLMQARHGLYVLPFSVRDGMGIGCPVDPSFALGGTRERDPYAEKIAKAEETGIDVAEEVLQRLRKFQ